MAWPAPEQIRVAQPNRLRPGAAGPTLPPDPVIDTSSHLLTGKVNTVAAGHFGSGFQVFIDSVGVLGPFDFDNLWSLFFPAGAATDSGSASAVADVADNTTMVGDEDPDVAGTGHVHGHITAQCLVREEIGMRARMRPYLTAGLAFTAAAVIAVASGSGGNPPGFPLPARQRC